MLKFAGKILEMLGKIQENSYENSKKFRKNGLKKLWEKFKKFEI